VDIESYYKEQTLRAQHVQLDNLLMLSQSIINYVGK